MHKSYKIGGADHDIFVYVYHAFFDDIYIAFFRSHHSSKYFSLFVHITVRKYFLSLFVHITVSKIFSIAFCVHITVSKIFPIAFSSRIAISSRHRFPTGKTNFR
ncbi:uncharacterized protein OCT59_020203 [Rhizophagus irregularis]|uniref:uncharacterized protein n=1 Tax=Rhizophagus irregularis TaxID=588596 RepID=UPI00332204F1|nr:hypothetical protein OCT59_020203 [Rhizophagus irregularis]